MASVRIIGDSWGETEAERAAAYPCDSLVTDPDQECFRALDVAAPASLVFRWLCQLRVAPYSYDWIDNRGRRSPRELTPGLEHLEVGQPFMIFTLTGFEPDRSITLDAPRSVFGELAATYQVTPAGDDASRLTVKLVVRYRRWRLMRFVPPIGDLVMMRKQLLNLRRLAERDHALAHVEPLG